MRRRRKGCQRGQRGGKKLYGEQRHRLTLFRIAREVGRPVFEIEAEMPATEYYEWVEIFRREDEEAEKRAKEAKKRR